MSRPRSEQRARYWQGLIGEQASSELSIQAFCLSRNVSTASFYQWRRRLGEMESSKLGPAPKASPSARSQFVAIDLPGPIAQPARSCEVVLTDGRRVLVPERFDGETLTALFTALRETSC